MRGPNTLVRIRDVTNAATIGVSGCQRPGAAAAVVDDSGMLHAQGHVSLAGSAAIEVQYQTVQATATVGLGRNANMGEVEVYTELLVFKE